jgi:hypothetical protein
MRIGLDDAMSLRLQIGRIAAVAVLVLAALGVTSEAQVRNSGASTITLQAVLSDSLTVTLSGNAVNFNLTPGSANNPGSVGITATTRWALQRFIANVRVYAFFASSTAALTNGAGTNIPSADFQISDNAGPFRALTNTVPFGGANAGLMLSNSGVFIFNRVGSHTDSMNFNINLSTVPNLPAGTYTGTLTIQAQAL